MGRYKSVKGRGEGGEDVVKCPAGKREGNLRKGGGVLI